MTRTDVHSPGSIVPTDYDFVGFSYLRVDDLCDAMFLQHHRQRIREHMQQTGGDYASHQHGGNCQVCGSANAVYTALFWHRPTNEYVRTGLDCAEKLECGEVERFRRDVRSALQSRAGKRKAVALLEAEGLEAAWAVYEATPWGQREEQTIGDVVSRLVKYGSVTEGQYGLLRSLLERISRRAEVEPRRAAEAAAALPLPLFQGRAVVVGKILTTKAEDGPFGPTTKVLVQHADGWKVWGSLPAALQTGEDDGQVKGRVVQFEAAVKPSSRDPKFGFFSRPTKARFVA